MCMFKPSHAKLYNSDYTVWKEHNKDNILLCDGRTTDDNVSESESWHVHLMNVSRISPNEDTGAVSGSA